MELLSSPFLKKVKRYQIVNFNHFTPPVKAPVHMHKRVSQAVPFFKFIFSLCLLRFECHS